MVQFLLYFTELPYPRNVLKKFGHKKILYSVEYFISPSVSGILSVVS